MKTSPWPSIEDLRLAYERLLGGAAARITVHDLAHWARWSRVDARLAEVLVRFIAKNFRLFDPFALRDANAALPQPQALAVLGEFALLMRANSLPGGREDFRAWLNILTKDLPVAPAQIFFVGGFVLQPERIRRKVELSLSPFQRWGYFGDEPLLPQKDLPRQSRTLLGPRERLNILDELILKRESVGGAGEITVNEYLASCLGQVHRRTAERDLNQHPNLKKIGHTRRRRYRIT